MLVLALAVLCGKVWAMDLQQAYQAALEKVETVQIEKHRIEQADARVTQSWASLMPSISLLGAYQRQDDSQTLGHEIAGRFRLRDQFNSRVALVQPVFRGLAEVAGLRLASAEQRAQKLQFEQTRLDLFGSVAQSYYQVLATEKDRENLRRLLELTEKRVGELRERSRIGRSREGEVLTAQAQVAVLKSQLQAAEAAVVQAREGFALTTRLSAGTPLDEPHPPDWAKLERSAQSVQPYLEGLHARPDLRALAETASATEQWVVMARSNHFPTVDFLANYHLKRVGIQEGVRWDIGVQLTLPLFAGGAVVSQVEEAIARSKEEQLRLAQARRSADTQIRTAFEALKAGVAQFSALQGATKIAERNYRIQTQDYRLGLVTNLEVLQALNMAEETRRTLDRVRYETLTAWAGLKVAVGQTL